ncbi:MAG: nuclear transport factor 2 family protein [Bacteroidales bacterium]|nr:nuclear transport factor 2 family protein [Bacteroidales bacterium]
MKNVISIISIVLLSVSLIAQNTENKENSINEIINSWHKAASDANLDAFFAPVTSDFVYIGTDATERWTRDEFYGFCKPYFDKGKAWDFKPIERKVYFSPNGKTAWFNETLDTWMGVCRSSGVLVKVKKKWKLAHYHLSVAVPNESVEEFLKCCSTPVDK